MSQKLDKFYEYLDRYQSLVKVNASKFVGEHYAEDVAQETFLRMYEHLEFLNDDMVKQWLIVVSGNLAKDYLKKGGKYKTNSEDPGALVQKRDKTMESAEASYLKKEKQQAACQLLQTACNLLFEKNPVWYYVMIDSCYLEMSSAEIAKVFKTTAGNIDVIKSRARKYLRKMMGDAAYDFF